MKKEVRIEEHDCFIYESATPPKWVLFQPVDEHDRMGLDEEVNYLRAHTDSAFTFVAFRVTDWNEALSPWKAPAVFGNENFGNGAAKTLQYVIEFLIPMYPDAFYCIGGYSLAGLFALWTSYQTSLCKGVVAASPSVWFEHWMDYAEHHVSLAEHVYLSLGDREKHTRNQTIAKVSKCIRRQYEILTRNKVLEWNKGNHFQDAAERMAKGFAWVLNEHGKSS